MKSPRPDEAPLVPQVHGALRQAGSSTVSAPSVVSHKSLYLRHPGESRGPGSKTGFKKPFDTLDTGVRRYDGIVIVKKR